MTADGALRNAAVAALLAWWEADCDHLSSTDARRAHPAYKALVAIGWAAVPQLIAELREGRYGEWDGALSEIHAGFDPVPLHEAGDMPAIARRWLAWWEEREAFARDPRFHTNPMKSEATK